MKFEVINSDGRVAMTTISLNCTPNKDVLENLSKAGYKFRIDGKTATKKKVLELKQ